MQLEDLRQPDVAARIILLAFATAIAGSCSTPNVRPQCHAALTHYYASGCTISGADEASAEDECTEAGDTAPDECQSTFESLLGCLNSTPVTVSSSAQCNCDDDWESAIDLCD
jgi:hypothetical protein